MGMTLAEKIMANHSGNKSLKAGDMIFANVDLVMGTDIASPLALRAFENMGGDEVFDKDKIALILDHLVPAKDIKSAEYSKIVRKFAKDHNITNFFDVGRSGLCHAIVMDEGLAVPGDLIVGADSHTCTYGALGALATGVGSTDMAATMILGENWFRVPSSIKINYSGVLPDKICGKDLILYTIKKLGVDGALYKSIEFSGEVIDGLSMSDRITICNMAIEAGAKFGVISPDETTFTFVRENSSREFTPVYPDEDAVYEQVIEIDVTDLEPQVAIPYSPANSVPVSEVTGITIDQIVIGSCTNGRIEDFRMAAEIMGDNPVHQDVRLIIIPSTRNLTLQLMDEGLTESFIKAGAVIGPSTCGPCLGAHMGVLAENEVGLYTTNRNFKGRNGHVSSKVYLCGPAVAGASAVTGRITDPR